MVLKFDHERIFIFILLKTKKKNSSNYIFYKYLCITSNK